MKWKSNIVDMKTEEIEKVSDEYAYRQYCGVTGNDRFDITRKVFDAYDIAQAFEKGIEWALQNQWRDVKTDKPKNGERIIMRVNYRSAKSGRYVVHIEEDYYFDQYPFELKEQTHKNLRYKITHWMPFPELPKKQRQ